MEDRKSRLLTSASRCNNPSVAFGNIPDPPEYLAAMSLDFSLVEEEAIPTGMVLVPRGTSWVDLNGFLNFPILTLDPFLIDKYEVTNEEFKEFVDAGGYQNPEYWDGLEFMKDEQTLSHQEAVAEFLDSTGRPGPSTWELGDYLEGQARYPVTGVSWYEANAYSRFRGRELPTLYHWARAGTNEEIVGALMPLSNIDGEGLQPVGSRDGIGPYGTYDTVGNAREWVWNQSGNQRWILGGAWTDRPYMARFRYSLPAFDRSPINGFRTVKYLAISEFPKWRKYLISLSFRGQSSVRPVQVGGFDVNIDIHRSTAVRGRGGPARHHAWPPYLGAILAHTDGPCGS